jgi:hypothetical protein
MSNQTGTVSIGNRTEDVNAALAVFMGDDNLPKPVSEEKPLPVSALNLLHIPSDCDRIEFSPDQETCTLLTFKKGGEALMALYFQRNAEGKVTAIGID